jgi:protein phosphatase
MLICPQCHFENPDKNKFCQSCGYTLTQKPCPKCGTLVAVNAQICHDCGASCGTLWKAIISEVETGLINPSLSQNNQNFATPIDCDIQRLKDLQTTSLDNQSLYEPASQDFEIKEASLELNLLGEDKTTETDPYCNIYLDSQKRYQLLESLPSKQEFNNHQQIFVKVLDCQPYQKTFLSAILANRQKGLAVPKIQSMSLLAKSYIALQPQSHHGIPIIHDAWQEEGKEFIVIEDRSHWQSLLNLWREDTVTPLQIVHWFDQMTNLWIALEPLRCRQSLLVLSNLRLDEDQVLALELLYPESNQNVVPNQSPEDTEIQISAVEEYYTIKTLGYVWQAMFRQSQRTQFGPLVQLLGDLELGKIDSMSSLRVRLSDIAASLQSHSPPQPSNSDEENFTFVQLDDFEDNVTRNDEMPTIALPVHLNALDDAGLSDVGRQRDRNEDYFGIETKINKLELPKKRTVQARGLYILCDGMGGHAGGEVASQLAVSSLKKYFQENWIENQLPTTEKIIDGVRLANKDIFDMNQEGARSGVGRMGTTLVMLLIQDSRAAVAHVGDSRLYQVTRKSGLKQITKDHEVGQREIDKGVEPSIAYARSDAYQLTQALGPRDENWVYPDVQFFDIQEDSIFLLASDGLSDNDLLESHWQTYLEPLLKSSANLERGVNDLIDLANQYNGHDNITAVLVRAKVRPNMEIKN